MLVALLSLVLTCVMLCGCANNETTCRRVISLVLLLLWLSAATLLTFRRPFTYTGNGFFACWFGVLQATEILHIEVFKSSQRDSYARVETATPAAQSQTATPVARPVAVPLGMPAYPAGDLPSKYPVGGALGAGAQARPEVVVDSMLARGGRG